MYKKVLRLWIFQYIKGFHYGFPASPLVFSLYIALFEGLCGALTFLPTHDCN